MTAEQQRQELPVASWSRWRRRVLAVAVPVVLAVAVVSQGAGGGAPAPTASPTGSVLVPTAPTPTPTPSPTPSLPVDEPVHDHDGEPDPIATPAPKAVLADLAAASDAAERALTAWWWSTSDEDDAERTTRLASVLTADAAMPSAPTLSGSPQWAVEGAVGYLVPLAGDDDLRQYAAQVQWVATGWEPGGAMSTYRGTQDLTVTVARLNGGGWLATAIDEQR